MKYIIDTDPGIDDAIAIMLGYLNKLDIIGFTLSSGNIPLDKSENNIKVIQDFLGSNIKMYKGLNKNECNYKTAEYAHGKDGFGYAVFPKNKRKFENKSAEKFIVESAKKYKDKLTIICLGPLTNLASAIKLNPSVMKQVSQILIMGTTYNPREKNPYYEFNINVDLLSAKTVFDFPFKKIKAVTHEIGVSSFVEKEYIESLKNSDKLISRFVSNISQKYMEFSYEHYKTIGLGTPDPTTISTLIKDDIVEFKPCKVEIITEGERKGECVVKLVNESNIYISTSFDLEKFRNLFKNTFN